MTGGETHQEFEGAVRRRLLLHGYALQGAFNGPALERTALRGESLHMREILAYGASGGTLSYRELVDAVSAGTISPYSLNAGWLGKLAHVCALQNVTPGDTDFALAALRCANKVLPELGEENRRYAKLEAELLFEERRFDELDALLAAREDLRKYYYGYLSVDSRNPFVRGEAQGTGRGRFSQARWLRGFNRQFVDTELLEVTLRPGHEAPFNRLTAAKPGEPVQNGPLVTVIMTTFQPERDDVLQSARSILAQTWTNLELLIVDDASPDESAPILDELEHLDPRIRVIRLEINGGTYRARNIGIEQARGAFVTGQDADDWSHPQRIERQAEELTANPDHPGNQVYTVNMTGDLVRIRRGYQPYIPSAPTLMVRTEILRELGGYLPARKAADNELRSRVAAYAGAPIGKIKDPLIFMRILPDSLSRADFRSGWQHPARRVFWSAYKTWHSSAHPEELQLTADESPVTIPPRFTQPPEERNRLDVVFAADWCEFGELQADMTAEIHALLDHGQRVGILHLENAQHLSRFARTIYEPVQQLISGRKVTAVLPDEDFHDIDLMLVRSPELLQFMPHGRTAFTTRRTAVVAERSPLSDDGWRVTYLPQDCETHAAEFFGTSLTWLPSGSQVSEAIRALFPMARISGQDYTTPFDTEEFCTVRSRLRSTRPVIGRWAGSLPTDWPARPETIRELWPVDGSADVRLYGDTSVVLRKLDEQYLPAHWMSYDGRSLSRAAFYRSLDFFIHYPQHIPEAPERSVLEALAAGCVVILPEMHRGLYGDAALYSRPAAVQALVARYAADTTLFLEQSARGVSFPLSRSRSSYAHTLRSLAEHPETTEQEILAG